MGRRGPRLSGEAPSPSVQGEGTTPVLEASWATFFPNDTRHCMHGAHGAQQAQIPRKEVFRAAVFVLGIPDTRGSPVPERTRAALEPISPSLLGEKHNDYGSKCRQSAGGTSQESPSRHSAGREGPRWLTGSHSPGSPLQPAQLWPTGHTLVRGLRYDAHNLFHTGQGRRHRPNSKPRCREVRPSARGHRG